MVLEFYYDLLSQPCRAVYLLLKAGGVEFKSVIVELLQGEHRKPEFLAKNPFHKIPIIIDEGFCLSESAAIMRYIITKNNLPDHWYPSKDAKKQAIVDEFVNWQHSCVRKPCVELFITQFRSVIEILPNFPKVPVDEKKRDAAKEEVGRAVKHIDEYFLKDKPFIAGDEISVADLMGMVELTHLEAIEMDSLYTSNPKVTDWIKRVQDKLQPHFDDANKKLMSMKLKYLESK